MTRYNQFNFLAFMNSKRCVTYMTYSILIDSKATCEMMPVRSASHSGIFCRVNCLSYRSCTGFIERSGLCIHAYHLMSRIVNKQPTSKPFKSYCYLIP